MSGLERPKGREKVLNFSTMTCDIVKLRALDTRWHEHSSTDAQAVATDHLQLLCGWLLCIWDVLTFQNPKKCWCNQFPYVPIMCRMCRCCCLLDGAISCSHHWSWNTLLVRNRRRRFRNGNHSIPCPFDNFSVPCFSVWILFVWLLKCWNYMKLCELMHLKIKPTRESILWLQQIGISLQRVERGEAPKRSAWRSFRDVLGWFSNIWLSYAELVWMGTWKWFHRLVKLKILLKWLGQIAGTHYARWSQPGFL